MARWQDQFTEEELERRRIYQRERAKRVRKTEAGKKSSKAAWDKFKGARSKETAYRTSRKATWQWKLRKYGVTEEQYELAARRGCEICGRSNTWKGTAARLCFDHNHTTGKFRGFLCHSCNSALGYLKDDVTLAKAAFEYLQART